MGRGRAGGPVAAPVSLHTRTTCQVAAARLPAHDHRASPRSPTAPPAVQSMQQVGPPRAPQPASPLGAGRAGPPEDDRGALPLGGGTGPYGYGPPLPDRPPFKVYLGNIPYDLDEEVVADFFSGLDVSAPQRQGGAAAGRCRQRPAPTCRRCRGITPTNAPPMHPPNRPQIVDIMITRHHDTGKPKGCFVEFKTQEHLSKALTADGEPMLRRPVRIQVAEPKRRDGFADRGRCAAGAGARVPPCMHVALRQGRRCRRRQRADAACCWPDAPAAGVAAALGGGLRTLDGAAATATARRAAASAAGMALAAATATAVSAANVTATAVSAATATAVSTAVTVTGRCAAGPPAVSTAKAASCGRLPAAAAC